jgi:aspartate aminotransferase-like enzyme/GNAT superfamily N-acetyltransferase
MKNCQLSFKAATEPWELEQIHCLNYRTFVEEIPQHPPNRERRLIDRFHAENSYFICLDRRQLVGMLAVRRQRPFSLDGKVAALDSYLPDGSVTCEIRLLAVEPEYRQTRVFAGLFKIAAEFAIRQGYTLGIASGTLRQAKLYANLGFVPFAEPVGTPGAMYQPMYFTLNSALKIFERLHAPAPASDEPISFLPGPVNVGRVVRDAFSAAPLSHRSACFMQMVRETKELLCGHTGARHVELLLGSGTLANDAVAAHVKLLESEGMVLANGEFGERLIDHATRHGLSFKSLRSAWGEPYDYEVIAQQLAAGEIAWLWSTHCETSTGILNDLGRLAELCNRHGTRLCMDCTSSLGTVPLDLRSVYLATSVSGKGLASFPGISMVFYNHEIAPDRRLPRYLDLGYYREQQGVPFTHSSNLVTALNRALHDLHGADRFATIRRRHGWLRTELEKAGFAIVAIERHASPAVISFIMPAPASSLRIGEELERRGFLLSYRSSYLIERNILQICLMGDNSDENCRAMLNSLIELSRDFRCKPTKLKDSDRREPHR